jgi:hypothetical protein
MYVCVGIQILQCPPFFFVCPFEDHVERLSTNGPETYAAECVLQESRQPQTCCAPCMFMHYNFCRIHSTLRVTTAMDAGLTNHVWSFGRIGGIIGQQNASNRRMMNKKTAVQGFGVALATPLAIGATAVVYKAWPQLHVSLILIFIGLWAGLFKTVVWVFTRGLPVTGAERPQAKQTILRLATFPRTPLISKQPTTQNCCPLTRMWIGGFCQLARVGPVVGPVI